MKIQWKKLIIALEITLGTGIFSGLLSMNDVATYQQVVKPSFSPPAWVFMIVWPILYILMGISLYFIFISESEYKKNALRAFTVQLALNFVWPLVFFNMQNFWFAFIIVILLWAAILVMLYFFNKVRPLAARLQIPYLLWVTFAAVLNLAVAILN